MTRRRPATRPRLESLDRRLVLSTLTPAQIDSAYGLNSITFSKGAIKGDGAGQTIAIVDAYQDPSIYADLSAFDARNGLSNPSLAATTPTTNASSNKVTFNTVDLAGSTSNASWNAEEGLDVEMAHAVAPGANIVLVEAKTAGLFDLINAIKAAKTLPGVSVISMSWGGPEFNGQQQFDSVFTTPAGHRGITYLASSGDEGAGALWPSASPNVVSVGGTSLMVSTTGARASESAWGGSGGGPSQFETKPTYQSQVVSGHSRSTPDVSGDADPNTGVVINSRGGQFQVGGTSMSAPIWAGLIAIADEGLAVAGKPTLDGATQTLPDLYKAPSTAFNDVTTGSRASVGYDASTGLGTPNAASLVAFLDGGSSTSRAAGGGGSTSTSTAKPSALAPSTFPSPSIASPTPTSPSPEASPEGPLALVPNLIPASSPAQAVDPAATDVALEGWYLGGSPKLRAKARG